MGFLLGAGLAACLDDRVPKDALVCPVLLAEANRPGARRCGKAPVRPPCLLHGQRLDLATGATDNGTCPIEVYRADLAPDGTINVEIP
jgi:hypothetical protein